MNTRITAMILAAACLLAVRPLPAQAQGTYVPTPVTVSKEKVKMNGKVYYSHVVLERQTLYSISKAYHVTVDEIYAANPTLKETGLQKNSIILVPVSAEAVPETVVTTVVQETPPATEGTAATAQAPQEPTVTEVPADQLPEYVEHIVKWYEEIDDIARKYGVKAEDIIKYNNLQGRKLTRKQVIRIPIRPENAETVQEELEPKTPVEVVKEVIEDLTTPPTQPVEDEKPAEEVFESKSIVDASLLLPLNVAGRPSDVNMDFYAGVLLAIRDLEAQGIGTRLSVYDVANGVIPSQETLARNDFVLGPVSAKDLGLVLDRTGGQVPVISPLDQKAATLLPNYPTLIQAPSPAETQYRELARWIAEERQLDEKVIVLTEKNVTNATGAALLAQIREAGLNPSVLSYSLSEGTSIPSRLTGMLSKNRTNRIVVASDRQSFMNDAVRNAGIVIAKGYDVILYAPSKVRTFDIDNSSYHIAQLHICSPYFVDYSDAAVKKFLLAYRALYNAEPSQFAFQGYDTARYFITLAAKYGKNWRKKLGELDQKGLHTDFQFEGQTNAAMRRIVYRSDYSTGLQK